MIGGGATPRRPFAGAREVAVVLPQAASAPGDDARALAQFGTLLREESAELALELGAPPRFVEADPGAGPRCLIGPATANPDLGRYRQAGDGRAGLWLDRERHGADLRL